MSVLLFNNRLLKKMFREDKQIITQGIGTYYIHELLYRLMFLKYDFVKGFKLNKLIVSSELPTYYFTVEHEFNLYTGWNKIENIFLYSVWAEKYKLLCENTKDRVKHLLGFVIKMIVMKSFCSFNYTRRSDCIRLFFTKLTIMFAIITSSSFIILSIVPAIIIRNLYKVFLKIYYNKKANSIYFFNKQTYYNKGYGERRRIY